MGALQFQFQSQSRLRVSKILSSTIRKWERDSPLLHDPLRTPVQSRCFSSNSMDDDWSFSNSEPRSSPPHRRSPPDPREARRAPRFTEEASAPHPEDNRNQRFNKHSEGSSSRFANEGPISRQRSESLSQKDFSFLEKFKLNTENQRGSSKEKTEQSFSARFSESMQENQSQPQCPPGADEIFKKMKETGLIPNAVAMLVVASVLLLFGDVGSQTILQHRFSYVGFNERMDNPGFSFTGGSSIDGGALQLTPDSQNDVVSLQNTSGRIMYHQPFKLWLADIDKKGEDDIVASFSSYFYINIFRKKEWNAGEGLTFLIAPTADVPDQSWGQWMGLTNATTDGDSRNQIVAIEFDTEKQDFDPDNNHIGLNINSIRSRKTVSLNKSGIDLSPEIGTNYSIWVEYDGKAKRLQVYMSINKAPKPDKPLLNEEINLKQYVKQESYIGFSASTGSPEIQLNCVLEWTLDLEHLPEKKDLTWLKILAGVGIPVLTIAILIGVWLFVGYRKKRRQSRDEESNVQGTLKRLPGMPREFKYKELKRATHNFHESMVLGNGGFGIVYKGVLQEKDRENTTSTNSIDRLEIAVKKFSRDNIKSKGDFLDELTIIHRLRHRNLVRLEGWCYEKGKLLLVYDFMPNGSLENHLYDVADQNVLNWRHRYKILVGVASALHYLHNEYDQTVLHRDIKSSNILLDSDFNARLGDFGLARALDPERNSYADLQCGGVAGTMGYVAPECFHEGRATPESDVYGFGAVVLEIVCGRRPGAIVEDEQNRYTLIDWVWKIHREGHIEKALDNRLGDDFVVDEARRLLLLGLACSHPMASERPQTQAILQILNGALPAPHVPPFKPAFMWPPMSTTSTSTTLTSFSNTNNSLP